MGSTVLFHTCLVDKQRGYLLQLVQRRPKQTPSDIASSRDILETGLNVVDH